MKIINIEQRSDMWRTWRESGIGASESAAIMGMSPYKTALQLWEEKTGRAFPQLVNADMQRGIDHEDEARYLFNEMRGKLFFPVCGEHDKHPAIKASFDGLSTDMTEIVEIKCPRGTKLSDAMCTQDEAIIRDMFPMYWCQVQHQYAVCDTADKAFLVAFLDGRINSIKIDRDEAFIAELVEKCNAFWEHVETDMQPDAANADYAVLNGEDAVCLAQQYVDTVARRKSLEEQEKAIKQQIYEMVGNRSAIVGNKVKVSCYDVSRVDYKKACEEAGIHLLPYTKVLVGTSRFTIIGEK